MSNSKGTKTRYRKDYQKFPYNVDGLKLIFQLYEDQTTVKAITRYSKNTSNLSPTNNLRLYGVELQLKQIAIDGIALDKSRYVLDDESLTISDVPESFILEITTEIYPEANTSLQGLYRSSSMYCTQCEAEGFRKITFFPDRPDVLTKITTRIEADKKSCPVLLSNGNPTANGSLEDGRHYAVWEDPFPKPSYLFALVAGDLHRIEDEFVTMSGRVVDLHIYVEERNLDKCAHAMRSLKKAMKWDEEQYGREYDLDIFMIVAVDDFNMGAMENKGLNIFNSKYVLSTPDSATDQDYLGIEGVVAHEYFHNWTGNRVTCRDWFQLSLKEGLTVFRDQEFSSDMNSRPVQRIDDVRLLKNFQFKEDAGPMAHPVRPDSYQEINNFYTSTVYNKGAEVIRMMRTLLGKSGFRAGMDLYFERHDGQAVTCDDFVQAMEDATGTDLGQFRLWYSQSGTPELQVEGNWDSEHAEYHLQITQDCPPTPGQPTKLPFHIPVAIGLVGEDGTDLIKGESTQVLHLTEKRQKFVIPGIQQQPTLSFLRDFSAPVRVARFHSRAELAHLARCDSNLYNRWESSMQFSQEVILEVAGMLETGRNPSIDSLYLKSMSDAIEGEQQDKALFALSLQLPAETTLAQEMPVIVPDLLHNARDIVASEVADHNVDSLLKLYHANAGEKCYSISSQAMAQRSVRNAVLKLLMSINPLPDEVVELCRIHYFESSNMTDTIGALSSIVDHDIPLKQEALNHFYERWKGDPLVLDKWFFLQSISSDSDTLNKVQELMEHPAFSITNPNKVRALIGGFCAANHYRFHDSEGRGYSFLVDQILRLDELNPQIAARMVSPFTNWKRYDSGRKELMRDCLEKIAGTEGLSRDVSEIVSKCLVP